MLVASEKTKLDSNIETTNQSRIYCEIPCHAFEGPSTSKSIHPAEQVDMLRGVMFYCETDECRVGTLWTVVIPTTASDVGDALQQMCERSIGSSH